MDSSDTITLVDYNPELEQQFESTLNEFGLLPTLSECYKNPSDAKKEAYNDCIKRTELFQQQLQAECDHLYIALWDFGCIAYDTLGFTFGARIGVERKSGDFLGKLYVVITKDNALCFTDF